MSDIQMFLCLKVGVDQLFIKKVKCRGTTSISSSEGFSWRDDIVAVHRLAESLVMPEFITLQKLNASAAISDVVNLFKCAK